MPEWIRVELGDVYLAHSLMEEFDLTWGERGVARASEESVATTVDLIPPHRSLEDFRCVISEWLRRYAIDSAEMEHEGGVVVVQAAIHPASPGEPLPPPRGPGLVATLKDEDADDSGVVYGPVVVEDADGRVLWESRDWMSVEQARRLAEIQGWSFMLDG